MRPHLYGPVAAIGDIEGKSLSTHVQINRAALGDLDFSGNHAVLLIWRGDIRQWGCVR